MQVRLARMVSASLAALVVCCAVAQAAGSSPTSTNGNKVQLVASGLKTPTSFAFGDGAVFEGDGGNSMSLPNGGLYLLKGSKATKITTPLAFVGGLQFHDGTLYISGAAIAATGPSFQILAYSGWNGTTFTSQKTIYTAPAGFQGFNGLAFGANGRLYVGVDTGLLNNNDHGPASTSPYLYDILSMDADGSDVKVFATGIRQPWQLAFPAGSNSPFVSDFGQDAAAKKPPDFLLRVKAGQNYGFPKCNWTSKAKCRGDAKPLKMFSPHSDVGGVVIFHGRLYLSEFGYDPKQHPPAVVSLPLSAKGTPKTIVKHFGAGDSVIGLGENGGYLYIGVVTKTQGLVYRLKI
jgi:glucose/arabinose dehydrogenase